MAAMSSGTTLDATDAVALLLGAGAGLGMYVIIAGGRPGPGSRLLHRLRQARADGRRGRQWYLRLGLAVAAAVLAGMTTGWPVGGLLTGLAVAFLPRVLGRDTGHVRRVAHVEATATWTEMLRDTLSAAAGLEQAILATAPLAPTAIRDEVADLARRIQQGQRLAPALRVLATQLADPTSDLVIAALVLAAEHRARHLSDLLGSLAAAARDQASMRLRVEAGRARTRTSVRVIVGTTLAFAALVVLLNRSYLAAYDSTGGQLVLAAIGALFAVGFAWLARIARVNEPERLLDLAASDGTRHDLGATS